MTSERPTADRHVPVMLERVLDLMAPGLEAARAAGRTPVALDGTLGMGGHTEAILRRHPDTIVVGIDRDTQALRLATERLSWAGDRLRTWHGTYDEVSEALADAGVEGVDAALYDLGVSSYQLDERERGFAYSYDAPLDMRMDPTAELTAETVVNTYPEAELRRIIRSWGEEKFAGRIAAAIVRSRAEEAFSSTGRLVEVIRGAVPAAAGKSGGHPAKRTFQALRIEVNAELEALEGVLPAALDALAVGGRLAVLAYHSLEDRMVKNILREASSDTAPAGLPVVPEEMQPRFGLLTRGAEKPSPEEVQTNPRAASARLRVAERLRSAR